MTAPVQYQPKHIAWQDREQPGISAAATAGTPTLLGRVVINTGGQFILKLYNGQNPKDFFAVITNPNGGDNFVYECVVDRGLTYTVEGPRTAANPYSITITYVDLPKP
jgi:hypothetical protein